MAFNFIRASAQHGTMVRTNSVSAWGCWFRATSLPTGTQTHPLDYMGTQVAGAATLGFTYRCLRLKDVGGTLKWSIFFTTPNVNQDWDCAATVTVGAWHHVMYLVDNNQNTPPSTIKLWEDGIPQTLTHSVGTNTGGPGYAGGTVCLLGAAGPDYWDGDIAEAFAAFPSAPVDVNFTDDEAAEMAAGRHPFWVIGDHRISAGTTTQRAYYFPLDCDENPATDPGRRPEELDVFGNRFELTLVNGPTYVEHPPLWVVGRN